MAMSQLQQSEHSEKGREMTLFYFNRKFQLGHSWYHKTRVRASENAWVSAAFAGRMPFSGPEIWRGEVQFLVFALWEVDKDHWP